MAGVIPSRPRAWPGEGPPRARSGFALWPRARTSDIILGREGAHCYGNPEAGIFFRRDRSLEFAQSEEASVGAASVSVIRDTHILYVCIYIF